MATLVKFLSGFIVYVFLKLIFCLHLPSSFNAEDASLTMLKFPSLSEECISLFLSINVTSFPLLLSPLVIVVCISSI